MGKLKDVVPALSGDDFKAIENMFVESKADNFLYLLRAHRKGIVDHLQVMTDLQITKNSLYVLGSRLYDKIQQYLSGDLFESSDKILSKVHEIPEICHTQPREVAIAFLTKLEQELNSLDMHSELVLVYSALKKVNLFSDQYFFYSQLYNKHIAYNLSIEKSEEILGNFNKILREYDFSRSPAYLERLRFLQKEINQHYALHQSRQIEVIKNLVECQLQLFGRSGDDQLLNTAATLRRTEEILSALPEGSPLKQWQICVEYLLFENAMQAGSVSEAQEYYEKILPHRARLLLSAHVAAASFFPVSEICYLQRLNGNEKLSELDSLQLFYDTGDLHSVMQVRIARSVCSFYKGKLKEAATELNQLLNEYSLKDHFHVALEIKLMLIYYYIRMKDFDMAMGIHKNLVRKIKAEYSHYQNVLHLTGIFAAEIKKEGKALGAQQGEQFILFEAKNNGHCEVLRPLMSDLRLRYKSL